MGAAQPVQHVVVRLRDEARVKHERVTVGVLQATDMAHGPDTIRARLDDRQAILLSRLMNDGGPGERPHRSCGGGVAPPELTTHALRAHAPSAVGTAACFRADVCAGGASVGDSAGATVGDTAPLAR
jgi:hypothetical protein